MADLILIVDSHIQRYSAYMYEKIMEKGGKPVYFQYLQFPATMRVSFQPEDPGQSWIQPSAEHPGFPVSAVKSVYFPQTIEFLRREQISGYSQEDGENIFQEIKTFLGSFFRQMDCLWVDPIDAHEQHFYKAHQLRLLREAGLKTPETLLTNDPEKVRVFYEKHQGQVIYKPCWFGAYAEKLTEEDLHPERLQTLAIAPVNFQQFIPGRDILVYLVKDEPFASEMWSDTMDFRSGSRVQYKPIELPAEAAADCVKLARTLGSNFNAIDLRRTPDGEYVFFEGNPSPAFIHYEEATGYPITERLVRLLMHPAA